MKDPKKSPEMMQVLQKSNNLIRSPAKVLAANFNTNPQNLPKLPVPKLQDTIERYLKTVEPHLSSDKFSKTKNLVQKFAEKGGVGEKLQTLLEQRGDYKENWLSEWWLNCAYLQYRDPVVVWSSPGVVFPFKKFLSESEKVTYAAQVITAALRYKNLIDTQQIAVDKVGKMELDMQQYNKIFGTCRIPGLPSDSLIFNSTSRHITLCVNDIFFKLPVYSQDGNILGESQLIDEIRNCIREASKFKNAPKVGILTSDSRDNWATAYSELTKNDNNRKQVEEIQKSLFVVCIDRENPQIQDFVTTGCHQLITGCGSRYNSGNRWYDKTVQFIIGTTGVTGLTYEHSPAEGQPIAVLTDYIIKYLKEMDNSETPEGGAQNYERPMMLPFQVTPALEESIQVASHNIDKLAKDLDMNYLHFSDYGKNFIKTQKFSPDSYIQMAIQYAFYRLHKTPGAQYESAQTRMYLHGRTECIRSCSNESIAFAKAMCEGRDDKEKVQKLRAAIDSHKKYVNAAIQGYGVDRHLLGLKLIAKENNIPMPEIYQDEGYAKSSHMRLSTSQVASVYDAFMCYGPLTNDGYGCCYSPRNNDLWFGLSSFKSNPETSTEAFRKSLQESLLHMQEILIAAGETPVKSKL